LQFNLTDAPLLREMETWQWRLPDGAGGGLGSRQ
jgi:hypothetical protein